MSTQFLIVLVISAAIVSFFAQKNKDWVPFVVLIFLAFFSALTVFLRILGRL